MIIFYRRSRYVDFYVARYGKLGIVTLTDVTSWKFQIGGSPSLSLNSAENR